ncbi:hypothetical protein D3C81_889920 [compost metagenome]
MFGQQLLHQPTLTLFGQPCHHHQQSADVIFRLIAIVLRVDTIGTQPPAQTQSGIAKQHVLFVQIHRTP